MTKAKNTFNLIKNIAALAVAMFFCVSSKPPSTKSKLVISFRHFVGNETLRLDSVHYKNALGQDYTISKFKYYIGNIVLGKENGMKYEGHEYFLINEEDETSKEIVLKNIPEGQYTTIS